MKTSLNKRGFSPPLVLLVLLIVSGVSLMGWYIWHMNQGPAKVVVKKSNAAKVPHDPKPIQDMPELRDGSGYYKNDAYGFAFSYPKEWGTPVLAESSGRIDIYFKTSDGQVGKYYVFLHTETITHLDTDSPTLNITGFAYSKPNMTIYNAGNLFQFNVSSDHILQNNKDGIIYAIDADDNSSAQYVDAVKHISAGKYKVAIFSSPGTDGQAATTTEVTKNLSGLLATFTEL